MDEDATWYGSWPRRKAHCIRRVPSTPRKGHSTPPLLGRCLLWPRSPVSATAELVLIGCTYSVFTSFISLRIIFHFSLSFTSTTFWHCDCHHLSSTFLTASYVSCCSLVSSARLPWDDCSLLGANSNQWHPVFHYITAHGYKRRPGNFYWALFFHMWFSMLWKFYWAGARAHEYTKR